MIWTLLIISMLLQGGGFFLYSKGKISDRQNLYAQTAALPFSLTALAISIANFQA